jgi:seryl-tRNA synthetase
MNTKDDAKLHEFDKVEWFDICKHIKPELTWEEYEPIWDTFQADKSARKRQQELN